MRGPQPTLNMTDTPRSHCAFTVFLHILTPLFLTTALGGTSFDYYHFSSDIPKQRKVNERSKAMLHKVPEMEFKSTQEIRQDVSDLGCLLSPRLLTRKGQTTFCSAVYLILPDFLMVAPGFATKT